MVYSDAGTQLKGAARQGDFIAPDLPGWSWEKIKNATSSKETVFRFVPPGAQHRNGLAESRVKLAKEAIKHVFADTSFNYAELQVALARVGAIINARPLGAKTLTNDILVPITSNQLLTNGTSNIADQPLIDISPENEIDLPAREKYANRVIMSWWKRYNAEVFYDLLPYQRYRDSKREKNLQAGDICFVKTDGKFKAEYRLCRIAKVYPDEVGDVRTVLIFTRPRDKRDLKKGYRHKAPGQKKMAVQSLCLLVPIEEQEDQDTSKFMGVEVDAVAED